MKQENARENLLTAVEYVLYAHKIELPTGFVKEALSNHPEFPSLAAITDCLTEWQIPHLGTRISKEDLHEIPLPALVNLDVEGGIMAPIRKISENAVDWLHPGKGWQRDSLESFRQKWNGVTVLMEPDDGAYSYAERVRKHYKQNDVWGEPLVISVMLLTLFGAIWSIAEVDITTSSQLLYILTGLNVVGGVITLTLLRQSMGPGNSLAERICSVGGRTDCRTITRSKAAYITGWLSWSELGFFYFAGGVITGVMGILLGEDELKQGLIIANLLSLPFTVYSLYYQLVIARSICLLCTGTVTILWAEFLAVVLLDSQAIKTFNFNNVDYFILFYLIPVVIWAVTKGMLMKLGQFDKQAAVFRKFKFSDLVTNAIFENNKRILPLLNGMKTVKLGSPLAEHVFTIVTNPHCNPCAQLHEDIEQMIHTTDRIRFEFVILGSSPDSLRVAAKILAGSNAGDRLSDWFVNSYRGYKKWARKYPNEMITKDIVDQLQLHERWCKIEGIEGTPKVYFNGISVPEMYKLNDFKYLTHILNKSENISA